MSRNILEEVTAYFGFVSSVMIQKGSDTNLSIKMLIV